MAYTYSKLATYSVGSGGTATLNFTNIPQNYTDLMLVASLRSDTGDVSSNTWLTFNGISSSSYSSRITYTSNGSTITSGEQISGTKTTILFSNSSTSTSNTFGNMSIYIPNYTSSDYKSWSADYVTENNAAAAHLGVISGLFSITSPITSIMLQPYATTWLQYSSIHLYGIKAEV